MSAYISMIGEKYNRLTVISEYKKGNRIIRQCICDCGNIANTTRHQLISGHTKSCGCLQKEIVRKNVYKHGYSNTRLQRIFSKMKRRCYNDHEPAYKYYGAKGIKICDEWLNNPELFYNWAMNNGYSDKLTIDRINVYGNYAPDNCRWATIQEQALNRTDNLIYEYNGKRQTEKEWAEEYGLNRNTLHNRIKRGWDIEKALTYPIDKSRRNKNAIRISEGVI